MTEITYIVNHPVKLSDHFDVPMDQSKWDGTSYEKKGDNTLTFVLVGVLALGLYLYYKKK